MGVKWTEQQQKVIDLRNRNILVSAAAGSGKTPALLENIIQKITNDRKKENYMLSRYGQKRKMEIICKSMNLLFQFRQY